MPSDRQLKVSLIETRTDNYVAIIHYNDRNDVAVVDPSSAQPVLSEAAKHGWNITHILSTHHHHDHVGGNTEIKRATGCIVIGAAADSDRIPEIDIKVSEGETVFIGDTRAKILQTDGHTVGHISFWFDEFDTLFCGDTLFPLGCGRLFEGSPEQMWDSLKKILKLSPDTLIYCGHEYALDNSKFAVTIEPSNTKLTERIAQFEAKRMRNEATVPFFLREELETNPFVRSGNDQIAAKLGLLGSSPLEVFTEIRRRKDEF